MSKNVIVLEGADSSGKTTLARAIIEKRPGTHYLHGLPYVGWVEEAHRAMLDAAVRHASNGETTVIDRHWISEYVYGPRFRDGAAYTDDVALRFDRLIRSHGMYVLCVPGDCLEHEKRFQRERPDKKELFDTMVGVAEAYRRLATGYMHHDTADYLGRYILHGDFAMKREECIVYDIDHHTSAKDFAARVLGRMQQ